MAFATHYFLKIRHTMRSVLFFLFLAAFAFIEIYPSPAQAQAQGSSVFTVRDIKVDITSQSAAQARDKAFKQALDIAFKRLSRRILRFEDASILPVPAPKELQRLVQDFEIRNEKLSAVRYKANYVFRFKQQAVRDYFDSQGLSYTDVGSKPVLVLPFYKTAQSMMLWDNENPWLQAWSRAEGNQGLVPVAVPIGDLKDVGFISDDDALSYNPSRLEEMRERYGAGDAIILIAAQPNRNPADMNMDQIAKSPLTVFIYRTDKSQPEFVKKITLTPDNAESRESLFDRGVARVFSLLQMNWKKQTLVDPHEQNNLNALISYSSLDEWVRIKNTLNTVQGLLEAKYLSISPAEAKIKLYFKGSEQRLRLALAQADLELSAPRMNIASLLKDDDNRSAPLTYRLKVIN